MGIGTLLFHHLPKAFWKVTVLPLAFPCDTCGFGSLNCVIGGMRGVTGNMDGCDSLTGCARGGASRRVIGVTSGGVGGKSGRTNLTHSHWYLTARPSPPHLNGLPGPVISRAFFLEIWKHVLCAAGSPAYQRPMIILRFSFCHFVLTSESSARLRMLFCNSVYPLPFRLFKYSFNFSLLECQTPLTFTAENLPFLARRLRYSWE